MQIGKYKITALEPETFGLDGGAMFGIIPKPLWNKNYPSDEKNRIKLSGKCLLLRSDSKNILVETGLGYGWDEKFEQIYDVQYKSPIKHLLESKGVMSDQITDVILTHLHFDHVGGAVEFNGVNVFPSFPNAKYHIQKKQFEWAQNPSDKDRGSFIHDRFIPIAEAGLFKFWEGSQNFDDEISFVEISGHTFSQQLVEISDSSQTLLYAADLLPTSSHIHVPYVMGYDIQPLVTIAEKQKILSQAVDEDWTIVFGHDAYIDGCKIDKTNKGFIVKNRIEKLV